MLRMPRCRRPAAANARRYDPRHRFGRGQRLYSLWERRSGVEASPLLLPRVGPRGALPSGLDVGLGNQASTSTISLSSSFQDESRSGTSASAATIGMTLGSRGAKCLALSAYTCKALACLVWRKAKSRLAACWPECAGCSGLRTAGRAARAADAQRCKLHHQRQPSTSARASAIACASSN